MSYPEGVVDNATPWVAKQIIEYVATDGQAANAQGWPLLLLTSRGRTTGTWHRTALIYGEVDGAHLIVASIGGAPKHPSWYLNLVANPRAWLQVGAEVFEVAARTATAAEKPPLWQHMVGIYATYDTYQEKTEREIPVIVLERIG